MCMLKPVLKSSPASVPVIEVSAKEWFVLQNINVARNIWDLLWLMSTLRICRLLYTSFSASVHPGVDMGTSEFNARG